MKLMEWETGITTNSKCSKSGRRTLEKIRSAGFENVMIDQEGERNLSRFVSIAFETGLKVPFIHIDSQDASKIWFDGQGSDFVQYARNTIEKCGRNGVDTVVMHASYDGLDIEPNKFGLCNMQQIVRVAEDNNVKIALENTDLETHNLFEFLMKNVESPNFGFCFDSGHWNLYMPENDLLKKFGDRLMALHLHDNIGYAINEEGWKKDLHLLPFDGTTDFDVVAKGIAKSSYAGPIMLESRRKHKAETLRYYGVEVQDFLAEAHSRAEKLAEMVKEYRE